MTQFLIGFIGLLSIFLVTRESGNLRLWGNPIGLLGQPFWLFETWTKAQGGMFILSVGMTVVYLLGCKKLLKHLANRKSEKAPDHRHLAG